MYKNKWTCLAWNALWIFAGNLITRPFIVPDKPLFSWNIPICAAIVLIMWPISWWMSESIRKRTEKLDSLLVEINQIVEGLRESNRKSHEAEAMRIIDEFLKHPETGVRLERPKSRTKEN